MMGRRLLLERLLLPCLIMIAGSAPPCSADCEKSFDAILCNSRSKGYAFKGNLVWTIECNKDFIYVLENSKRELPFEPSAAFTDDQFSYLFQGDQVWVTNGLNLDSVQGPLPIVDVFNGFPGRVAAAFYAANDVYLMSAGSGPNNEFHIYTQRVFTKDKLPAWLFSTQEETDLRLAHPKIRHLRSAFSVSSDTERAQLILIFNETSFYKLDLANCLRKVGPRLKLSDGCMAGKPGKTEALFRCAWFAWTTLVAVSGVILVCVLLALYLVVLFICYKRHQDSGTFRHKQTCCREGEGHLYFSGVDHVQGDEASFLDTASETTTIASNYNEDKPSIDLNEACYGKYGKY